jgi:hypothetical protein
MDKTVQADDDNFDTLGLVQGFEEKLKSAIEEKYEDQPLSHRAILLKSNVMSRFDLEVIYYALIQAKVSKDRISKLMHALFDIKLQLFYIGEIDMGLYKSVLYRADYDPLDPTPLESIKKMSLDQNVIVKSRILWERMINFVSIYISGEEVNVSSGKSKKGKFAKLIEDTPWSFLKDYWQTLEWFDATLRTPEVHSGSVLRRYFQHTEEIFNDEGLLVLYNIAINLFYPNIVAIIGGQEAPYKVWTIGMKEPNVTPS